MFDSVSCTRPKPLALGKLITWYKSRYLPLRTPEPEHRGRDSSAIGLRRLSGEGRDGFAHEVSEDPVVHDERAYSSGCMDIRLD